MCSNSPLLFVDKIACSKNNTHTLRDVRGRGFKKSYTVDP